MSRLNREPSATSEIPEAGISLADDEHKVLRNAEPNPAVDAVDSRKARTLRISNRPIEQDPSATGVQDSQAGQLATVNTWQLATLLIRASALIAQRDCGDRRGLLKGELGHPPGHVVSSDSGAPESLRKTCELLSECLVQLGIPQLGEDASSLSIVGVARRVIAVLDGDRENLIGGVDAREHLRLECHRIISTMIDNSVARDAEHAEQANRFYQFAYGLTHEINNPLANISARAELLLKDVTDEGSRRQLLTMMDQCQRAYEMLAEVMHVVKPSSMRMVAVSLPRDLTTLFERFDRLARENDIHFQFDQIPDVKMCLDVSQLSEALWAILKNSLENCHRGQDIRVQFFMGDETSDQGGFCSDTIIADQQDGAQQSRTESEKLGVGRRWKGARMLGISIDDSGRGPSPTDLRNAFEVFYSGREFGRGLGIGLAKAKRIIEAHRGKITIVGREAAGCSVRIYLPLGT